jgi:hypothetical protein
LDIVFNYRRDNPARTYKTREEEKIDPSQEFGMTRGRGSGITSAIQAFVMFFFGKNDLLKEKSMPCVVVYRKQDNLGSNEL